MRICAVIPWNLAAKIVPDNNQDEPGIKHRCKWPGEPGVDAGDTLQILRQEQDEPCQETYQAQLLFCALIHGKTHRFALHYSVCSGYI